MKIFDKALKTVGLRRIKNSIYKGAEYGRLMMDWVLSACTIDQEIRTDLPRLRGHARDLAKNNPFIRQYLTLLPVNVIGANGMTMQAQVRNNSGDLNKTINDKIEAGWAEWSKSVTPCGKMSRIQFEHLVIKTVATDGEAFIRKLVGFPNRHGLALQLIDADMIDHEFNRPKENGKNEIRLGVESDEWRRPVAFWFYDRPMNDVNGTAIQRIRIPAEEIIHLYDPERTNQTRGTTWFNSVMVPIKMLAGYSEAELVAARTGASNMGWLEYGEGSDFEAPDPKTPIKMEAKPGSVQMLPPGLTFKEWSPSHPNTAYPIFVKDVKRDIATGLRVSYNSLFNDLEGVNYSSMRSGLLIERDVWRMLQRWWIDRLLQPVYEAWLSTSILTGALVLDSRDSRKFQNIKWTPRGWAWVDPLKDVNATVIAIKNGLESRTGALAEKGDDLEDIFEELNAEKKLAESYGMVFEGEAMPVQPEDDEETPVKKPAMRLAT